jgi:hypothetical protein
MHMAELGVTARDAYNGAMVHSNPIRGTLGTAPSYQGFQTEEIAVLRLKAGESAGPFPLAGRQDEINLASVGKNGEITIWGECGEELWRGTVHACLQHPQFGEWVSAQRSAVLTERGWFARVLT